MQFFDRPSPILEHAVQHAVGNEFAVHQHAVAVEQYGFKLHSYQRKLGKR
jgi:hypothetical protein